MLWIWVAQSHHPCRSPWAYRRRHSFPGLLRKHLQWTVAACWYHWILSISHSFVLGHQLLCQYKVVLSHSFCFLFTFQMRNNLFVSWSAHWSLLCQMFSGSFPVSVLPRRGPTFPAQCVPFLELLSLPPSAPALAWRRLNSSYPQILISL